MTVSATVTRRCHLHDDSGIETRSYDVKQLLSMRSKLALVELPSLLEKELIARDVRITVNVLCEDR